MTKRKMLEDLAETIRSGKAKDVSDAAKHRIQDVDGRYVSLTDDDALEVVERRVAALEEVGNG